MDLIRPKSRTRHRTITVVDLPERFADRKAIRQHFSQFGHVTRVTLSSDYTSADVHFKTEEDARNAANNGDVWRDELLTIVGAPAPHFDPRASSPEDGKVFDELLELDDDDDNDNTAQSVKNNLLLTAVHGSRADDKKLKRVRSSRKVMLDHLGAPKIKRPSTDPSDFLKSNVDNSSSFRVSLSGDTMPLKKLVSSPKSSKVVKVKKKETVSKPKMSPKNFKHVIARSLKDKFAVLNERDKWLKKLLAKSGGSKSTLRGTCPDMCPEKERIMRDYRNLYSIFETENKEMAHKLAIKEYSRSSADQEEPLPHELRPAPVLTMTMSYLINHIIPEIDNPNLKESVSEWFDFCWDRLRGIRKDITQQQLCDVSIVAIIEQCARFHIACYDRLYGLEMKIFDQKINRENIMNCLSSLNHLYDSLSSSGMCTNEAEFKAYQVLLQLNSSDILWEFQNFPQHIQDSSELKVAVKAYLLFSSRSYAQFFDLVQNTSYLNSCLLQTYFPIIRETALIIITKAYSPPIKTFPLNADFVKQSLRLDDTELEEFCTNNRIAFYLDSNEVVINREELFARDLVFSFDSSSYIVAEKRIALPFVVVKSDVLPSYMTHKVHSSFDDEGKLSKLAYQAVDQEMKLKQDFDFSYRPLLDPSELKYDSDSDVQIISDEDEEKFSGDESPYAQPELIELDDERTERDRTDGSNHRFLFNVQASRPKEDTSETLEEDGNLLLQNLEKYKRHELILRKNDEWERKKGEELRKASHQKIQEEARRIEEDRKLKMQQELEKQAALMREKQHREAEARAKQERDIKEMEEAIQRKIKEEKERAQMLLEEKRQREEEQRKREIFAKEQEKLRRQEIERQRKICEEEEMQKRLREEQQKIKEEKERLRKIQEEEKRREEAERKRRIDEAERQRKLKEEIRRQHLLKEKEEELKILRNYLGMRLKALSVRHYARTWKKKIEKIRQANINFPALVRMTADENLALWGTVGNRSSVPPLRTSERINRLKSASKVISKLNQSKLNVPFVGDILAEMIVDENLKLSESLIQFVFCKLVFSFPTYIEENIFQFVKQSLASALLPKECKFSEGYSIITSHKIPAFTSINVIQGLSNVDSCYGMNGLVVFSQNESSHELQTRICKILNSLKCSVPIPLIVTTLDEGFSSKELTEFLNLLKQNKVLIHWEIQNWTSWPSFCKLFLFVFSKYIFSPGNITVNSFCNLMKNLMDEFFSILRSEEDFSVPVNIIESYNLFLAKIQQYFSTFKHQDIPVEFESLLVKNSSCFVSSVKPNVSNDTKHLKNLLDRLLLENFEKETPKSIKSLLNLLERHCHSNRLLFSQIVRLLELNDDDEKDFNSFLKRIPWISIIEKLAQGKLETLNKSGNPVFVVFKMKDLLQLTHN